MGQGWLILWSGILCRCDFHLELHICHMSSTVLLLEQIAGLALGSMITWKTFSLARQDCDIMIPEPWVLI